METQKFSKKVNYKIKFNNSIFPVYSTNLTQKSFNPILYLKSKKLNFFFFDKFELNNKFTFEENIILYAEVEGKTFEYSFGKEAFMFYDNYDNRKLIKFKTNDDSIYTHILFEYNDLKINFDSCVISTNYMWGFPEYCRKNNIDMY